MAETETKPSNSGEAETPTTDGRMMMDIVERLLTLPEVAEILGVPVATLYRWRHRGEGPPGYRIGRHVRYRRATVDAWVETQADHRIAG
jgi:excisionase family DNA binding protein